MTHHDPYDESSITFHTAEYDPRFDWRLAEEWAVKYAKPVEWIRRSIAACRDAQVCPSYFRDRYLNGDRSILMHEGVDAASRRMEDRP